MIWLEEYVSDFEKSIYFKKQNGWKEVLAIDKLKLTKRIDDLSKKINDNDNADITHLDFDSFSEAEKTLFREVDEIEKDFQQTGNEDILIKNGDLIFKSIEIIVKHVTELYCHILPTALACYEKREIVDYFFKQHFYNFEMDLSECLAHVHTTWTDKDRDEFLLDLKKNGAYFFRIPRGFNEYNCEEHNDLIDSKNLDEKSDHNDYSK